MRPSRQRLLLVEDDNSLAEGLTDALGLEGYRVTHVRDGRLGLTEALGGRYPLVILDAMLPGLSGFDVLKRLRLQEPDILVLMLTARSQEMDKVRGLKLGADDYVTKPFSLTELTARVEALLRRHKTVRPPGKFVEGDLEVDFRARTATRKGESLCLTGREFEILEMLHHHRGEAVSRNDLLARIWGLADDVEVSTRTVDQHIASLRRKLGDDPDSPHLIQTVYGHGYRME